MAFQPITSLNLILFGDDICEFVDFGSGGHSLSDFCFISGQPGMASEQGEEFQPQVPPSWVTKLVFYASKNALGG